MSNDNLEKCPDCGAKLIVNMNENEMICKYCGYKQHVDIDKSKFEEESTNKDVSFQSASAGMEDNEMTANEKVMMTEKIMFYIFLIVFVIAICLVLMIMGILYK
ncbi:MAG: hypothetical protein IKP66_06390 [Lachnospiraceae bacterium]|nr:hypothetical protein [Lachnospiraceae bacterium]